MKKVILVIRDGWGFNPKKEKNAIKAANTKNTDRLMKEYPNTLLNASGQAVGLPKGFQGNSEVGHLTIGSGRIVFQPMERINKAIKTGKFFKNKAFLKAIKSCKKNKSTMHLMGLLQSEGVHSHENHLYALLKLCKRKGLKKVLIHAITDGRDAPPTNGIKHLKKLKRKIKELGIGEIATISGRYYTMDRNKQWKRTKKSYDCIVLGKSVREFENPEKALLACYKRKETDEFIKPEKRKGYEGIKKGDSVIFFNFRTDRTRQITQAIVEPKFKAWKRKPLKIVFVAITSYYKPMNAEVAFKDIFHKNLLGQALSRKGILQLRISETEKYAHVTFFFNGQNEKPEKGEKRILINSPNIATYDLKPEMSAFKVTKKLVEEIKKDKFGFVVVNIVNGDLVGHTGIWKACVKAAETVDKCLGKIVNAGLEKDYTLLVFADHGNLEDQSPKRATSHTINKVPLIMISNNKKFKNCKLKKNMGLQDIAPTVLEIMGIKKPKEMTGKSLLQY